jgi:hypothetical protein
MEASEPVKEQQAHAAVVKEDTMSERKPDTPPGQDPNRVPPGQDPGRTPPGQTPRPDNELPEEEEKEPQR